MKGTSDLLIAYNDLQIQAMMFDMAIDVETLTLEPKSDYKEAPWLTRWKEREDGKDHNNRFDYDCE